MAILNEMAKQQLKESFELQATKQMTMDKALISAVGIVDDVLKAFDGKKVNKRITTKIQEALDKYCPDYKMYAHFETAASVDHRWLYVRCNNSQMRSYQNSIGAWRYLSRDSFCINVFFEPIEGRLDLHKTEEDIVRAEDALEKDMEQYEQCLANFDEYVEMGEELKRMKEEYDKKCPYMLRRQVDVSSQIGELGYW